MITFLDKRQQFCEEIVKIILSSTSYERCWFQCAFTKQFSAREFSCPDLSRYEFLKDRLLVHFGYNSMIMSAKGLSAFSSGKRSDHLTLDINFDKLTIQASNLRQNNDAGSRALEIAPKLFKRYFPLKFIANKYSV